MSRFCFHSRLGLGVGHCEVVLGDEATLDDERTKNPSDLRGGWNQSGRETGEEQRGFPPVGKQQFKNQINSFR